MAAVRLAKDLSSEVPVIVASLIAAIRCGVASAVLKCSHFHVAAAAAAAYP